MGYLDWQAGIMATVGEDFMPAARLYELAAQVPPDQHIVEVGSYCGKSALTMAAGAWDGLGARVYHVDTWGLLIAPANAYNVIGNLGYILDRAEALGLISQITPLRGYSADLAAVRKWRIGMMFIDAGHYRADLESDIAAWIPQVVSGAHVLFHDYTYPLSPDVKLVLDEWYARVGPNGTGEWGQWQIIEPIEKTWTVEVVRA
jgi:hypothetical protein